MRRIKPRASARKTTDLSRRCGLCGSTTKPLTHAPCCGNWICDDEDQYVPFSYARNSCHRNHSRYTLCGFHHAEGHTGRWQDCKKCRDNLNAEMYVCYGTNEYNFEKLENPPAFEPTRCAQCGRVIHLGTEGHMLHPDGTYSCEICMEEEMRRIMESGRGGRKK